MRPDDAGSQKRFKQGVPGAGVAQKGAVEQRQILAAQLDTHVVQRGLRRKISSQIFQTCSIHTQGLPDCSSNVRL